jgi:hypothetical protein
VSAVPLAETLSANKDKDRVQQNKYDSLPTNIDRLELSSAGVGPADKVLDDVAVGSLPYPVAVIAPVNASFIEAVDLHRTRPSVGVRSWQQGYWCVCLCPHSLEGNRKRKRRKRRKKCNSPTAHELFFFFFFFFCVCEP